MTCNCNKPLTYNSPCQCPPSKCATDDIPPCGYELAPQPEFTCGPNFISSFKRMTLTECTQGLMFPVCDEEAELKDIVGYFTRRGTAQAVLKYPAFTITPEGATFRFDSKLNKLKCGRYLFTVKYKDCDVCAEIEIDITQRCVVKDSIPSVIKSLAPLPKLDAPQGATPMYDSVSSLNIELCAPLVEGQIVLPISLIDAQMLCALVLCKPVELVISDGVSREIVKFSGCTEGMPIIARGQSGTMQSKFPKGSAVSFYWTQANVANAMGGC